MEAAAAARRAFLNFLRGMETGNDVTLLAFTGTLPKLP